MRGVWSNDLSMPSFRDPDGQMWVWDSASQTYTQRTDDPMQVDRSHNWGGDNDLFSTNQIEHSEKSKNPFQEGYMASEWARPNEVKCPNCEQTTGDSVCPQCHKDLTPEWNQKGGDDYPFDSPPQEHHLDGMPERVPKPNYEHWDNSFPSMISHLRKLGFEGSDDDLMGMLTSGPTKAEVGRWLVDRQGHMHYEHGAQSLHERIASRDGLNWPNDIGATGAVYNDGSADVMRVFPHAPFNREQVEQQLVQAFGEGIHLDGPVGSTPIQEKGHAFDPVVIQGGQWLITPQMSQNLITGLAWVKERPNGVQYEPHMVFVTEALQPEDYPVHNNRSAAIVTATGGAFSHAAYLASTEGIPTIVGIGPEYSKIETGNYLKIDPTSKTLTVLPAPTGDWSSEQKQDAWNSILQHQRGIEQNQMTPKPAYFSHIDEELAWRESNSATLDDCPECHSPLMEKESSKICYSCGHKQPIIHVAGPMAIVPEVAGELGGMGAAAGGAAGGTPGLGQIGSLMTKALGPGQTSYPGLPGAGESLHGVADGLMSGPTPVDDDSASQGVIAKAPFGEDDDEEGTATKERGDDVDPDNAGSSGSGFDKDMGDGPELLKDVDGIGGPKDAGGTDAEQGEEHRLHDPESQHKALKAFHMNLPLVIEFANSDLSGGDNPILKALDELLEQAFPGYKDGLDPEGATPTEEHPDAKPESYEPDGDSDDSKDEPSAKEASLWHFAMGEMGDMGQITGWPSGVPANASICPTCHQPHAPGQPCMPEATMPQPGAVGMPGAIPGVPQGGGNPLYAGGQVPALPGSAVRQKVVTKYEKWSILEGVRDLASDVGGWAADKATDAAIALEQRGLKSIPGCPNCGGQRNPDYSCPTCQDQTSSGMTLNDLGITPESENYYRHAAEEHHHHEEHPAPEHDVDSGGSDMVQWLDDAGAPLNEGSDYELKSPNYQIPDKVTIVKVLPEKLIFTIHSGDVDYQDEITKQDVANEGYTFAPSGESPLGDSEDGFPQPEHPVRPGADALPQTTDLSSPSTVVSALEDYTGSFSGDSPDARSWLNEGSSIEVDPHTLAQVLGSASDVVDSGSTRLPEARYAGRDYSPREQRAFIEESGTARNLDRLQLEGTHYIDDDPLEVSFNW